MIRKIQLGATTRHEVFAEPTPLGLIGLSIGCGLEPRAAGRSILPDVEYLAESGSLALTKQGEESGRPQTVRLSAEGIDFYEQVVLKKDHLV